MPFAVVVGCQWGDEGKGKIVDLLAADFDWVARFQGGANAGHTVIVDGRQYILHLTPTGMLRSDVRCAIGNGVVVDPEALLEEIRSLEGNGISCRDRLRLSALAHVVTPLQRAQESLSDQDEAIGTTRRGIGPAYEQRASRYGLRIEDLLDPVALAERVAAQWSRLEPVARARGTTVEQAVGSTREVLVERLSSAGRELAPLVCDVSDLLLTADRAGERVLCEGAQGAWLDVDHGTYPFVTSSSTTVGGVCIGLGVPPQRIGKVIGVVKAYTTRVGLGPFPTEFQGPLADQFRERAGEYGATTRRPRRCGWYDAVLARRACRINGVDELVITKLDVMAGFDRIRVAVSYAWNEARFRSPEATTKSRWYSGRTLGEAVPSYVETPGWTETLAEVRAFAELPQAARRYLGLLSEQTEVPVGLVSIGPGREQVLRTSP